MSFLNLFRIPEIRTKILITIGLLLCYRLGFFIPLPGVDYAEFTNLAKSSGGASGLEKLAGMVNVLTGARLSQASVFSLGVMPYISASIIFSLLVKVVPSLEKLSKEGASGQRKINQYTRFATVAICILQSFFVIFGPLSRGFGGNSSILHDGVSEYWLLYVPMVMLALTAGTLFIMWLGEQITEHGVGNGISLIIMAGIIAQLQPAFMSYFTGGSASTATEMWQTALMFLAAWGLAVVAVVYMTKAQRRIPIQQAKMTRGRRVYGGQRHFLPIKVNHAGVMPIIFASALLIIPSLLGEAVGWKGLADSFNSQRGFWYVVFYAGLIFFFSFFWTSLMFQPNEMADNLKEHGSFIPGIRPGKKTAEFLERTMIRITLAGAAFLAIVAVFPTFITGSFSGLDTALIYFMSGTSILIVVGVALDLVEKLSALLVMRNYGGVPGADGQSAGGETQPGWGRR